MKYPASRVLVTAATVFCALALLAGCVSLPSKQVVPGAIVCDIIHAPTDEEIMNEGFAARVKRLTEQAKTAPDSQTRASLHIRLATLLMDHRNPGKDYARAAREIAYYQAVTGDIGCAETARNIRGILKRPKPPGISPKMKQLKGKVKSLSQKLDQCRKTSSQKLDQCRESSSQKLDQCRESITTCNDTVKRLQEIDVRMERKRRDIR
ncbi:MAG TPA: hypothetical protein ENI12_02650 [Nitrospirae bacterium]|nr:hypothetical protein [Nitrospirota bacterium]